jgi:hypothetical protein
MGMFIFNPLIFLILFFNYSIKILIFEAIEISYCLNDCNSLKKIGKYITFLYY